MTGPDGEDTPASAEAWLDREIDSLFNKMMRAESSTERHYFCDAMAAAAKRRSVRLQLKMFAKLRDLGDDGSAQ